MVSPDRLLAMEKAIEDRNLAKVRLLLKAGVPAEYAYHPSLGWTFGNLAARTGDYAIFCCLIDAGADIHFRGGPIDQSMLEQAVCSRSASLPIVEKVLADGAPSQSDLDRSLLFAPDYGNLPVVERLLAAGADPRYADEDGTTALAHAVVNRQSAIALRLLQAGADPNRRAQFDEYYKKSIREVAAIHEMLEFLSACDGHTLEPIVVEPPETLVACLQSIMDRLPGQRVLRELAADLELPEPFAEASGAADMITLYAAAGTLADESVVPMPDDISYSLMTLPDALRERQMWVDVNSQERSGGNVSGDFWQLTWLPFASNGGGDGLVWDVATGRIWRFSHETRLATPRAASVLELFQDIATGLQTGKYSYSDARGIA